MYLKVKVAKFIYLSFVFVWSVTSCSLTRKLPAKNYLLKANEISIDSKLISKDDISYILKQQPNKKVLGISLKLRIYNSIDSSKVAQRRQKSFERFAKKIERKKVRYSKINKRRIDKARSKNKDFYIEKELKDTIYSKLLFLERLKYQSGQKPIVFDSLLFSKSQEQIVLYLRKKGFYYSKVRGEVTYNEKKRFAKTDFKIEVGPRYIIDSVKYKGQEKIKSYNSGFIQSQISANGKDPLVNQPFDLDYLDEYRSTISKYMRDRQIYKFYASTISFKVDTLKSTMKVNLTVNFDDRYIPSSINPDSLIKVPFVESYINNVYFHLADSVNFKGNFQALLKEKQLDIRDPLAAQFMRTINSLEYSKLRATKKQIKESKGKIKTGDPNLFRVVNLSYNGEKPWLKPEILELQNYLEHTNKYKEYYLDRSYRSLVQLGVFSAVKPILIEVPNSNLIDLHYYLEPSEKQSFGFDPKFTTSFGLLGASASLNYTNKNLFRGAEKITLSFGGGFESQPKIFDDNTSQRTFNTFEFGPSIKFDFPGLFPMPLTMLSKRQKPRTLFLLAYNLEKRSIFDRQVFQLNYMWKFLSGKTQVFQLGLPFMSGIKYVRIDKSESFNQQLSQINDPFLSNSYSSQFIWQDFKFSIEYNNKDRDYLNGKKRFLDANIYFNSTIDAAGNLLYMFREIQEKNELGQNMFQNLPYSQFVRIDNQFIASRNLKRTQSLHLKFSIGGGKPFGNSTTSMPYDYSFFGGGSNDNRGWRSRALGPGGYKYHLDSNSLITQVADIRIGGSFEYRFPITSSLKGAFFSDFGNIWTYKEDSRIGGKFAWDSFLSQFCIASGFGARLDLDFFVLRVDIGFPIYNPSYQNGAKWVFNDLFSNYRETYYQEGVATHGSLENAKAKMPKPFVPVLHFGIGYPF